jgi:hypothetical protein
MRPGRPSKAVPGLGAIRSDDRGSSLGDEMDVARKLVGRWETRTSDPLIKSRAYRQVPGLAQRGGCLTES